MLFLKEGDNIFLVINGGMCCDFMECRKKDCFSCAVYNGFIYLHYANCFMEKHKFIYFPYGTTIILNEE